MRAVSKSAVENARIGFLSWELMNDECRNGKALSQKARFGLFPRMFLYVSLSQDC